LLILIDYHRRANARKRLIEHDVRRSTLNHLAFEIPPEIYAAHFERLQQRDLNPVEAEFPAMNANAIFFKDPVGNALELICSCTDVN
jgi:catechol-2,3-dioxygenase